jgi:hypothetical protein
MLGVVSACLVTAAVVPAAGLAESGAISGVHAVGSQLEATVSATHDACNTSINYCGWFPVLYDLQPGTSCSSPGITVWAGDYDPDAGTQTATVDFYPNYQGNGDHLCLYVDTGSTTTLIAETTYVPPAPPPPPAIPAQHTEPIPGWVGHQVDAYHFNDASVNDAVGPSSLDGSVVLTLVTRSALRWGITIDGTTSASPDDLDGENTIGFSYSLPDSALGETDIYFRKVYRPGRLRCTIRRRRGRRIKVCHRGTPQFVGTQVTEEDIRINANAPWNEGPYYPDAGHYDLESTLLHELGHFAGNAAHVHGCTDSPMIDAASMGDWWHASADWHRAGCAAARDLGPGAKVGPGTSSKRGYYITRYIDESRHPGSQPKTPAYLPKLHR